MNVIYMVWGYNINLTEDKNSTINMYTHRLWKAENTLQDIFAAPKLPYNVHIPYTVKVEKCATWFCLWLIFELIYHELYVWKFLFGCSFIAGLYLLVIFALFTTP